MENQVEELTLSDILHIFKKRQLWFWMVFVLTIVATGVYLVFFATPIYEVSVKIKIPSKSSSPSLSSLSGAAALMLGGGMTSLGVSDEMELIKSRRTLQKVIKDLNLMDYFKSKIKDEEGKEKLTLNSVIDKLQEEVISVETVKDTSFVEIKVSLDDKEMAYKLSKKILEAYTEVSKELNKDQNTYMVEFIEKQLPQTEKELEKVEERLKKFKKEKSILPSKEAELLVDNLAEFDKKYYSAQLELTGLKIKFENLKSSISQFKELISKLDYVPNSPVISLLREKLVEYQIEYQGLLQKYSPDSIEVKEIEVKINEIEKKIKEEIDNIVKSSFNMDDPVLSNIYTQLVETQAALEISKANLESLVKLRAKFEEKLKELPDIEMEYINLERDYQLKQNAYILLKTKLEELKLSTAGFNFNAPIIVDEPFIPEKPSKPNKKLTLAIGGVLGIFIGILFVFVAEARDKKIRDWFDVEKTIGKKPIVLVEPDMNLSIFKAPGSRYSNLVEKIAMKIVSDSNPNVIGITSVGSFREKEIFSANFAGFFAKSGKKTLLLDFENSMYKIFDVNGGKTLVEVLKKNNDIQKVEENLYLIIKGRENVNDILISEDFEELMRRFKEEFNYVIINLPGSDSSSIPLLKKLCDELILVVKEKITDKEKFIESMEELKTRYIVLSE
ncbi:lipopolysaccharide biosynthesis protein [Thermosipho melanesiensis]|uniref:Lipopolysaccharide biosynthesis protein n=2 Tax=Thermosipho melanesiensis TaxID=46541 RepID=A6LKS2_THEM4|nr:exopolysaccharide transport family protein [Thermosipho melanesiensis]ABR30523.1 lipopolysaccharide biosynthesis protein [Thermosipho melanesiensis BI429]APT73672.1 lipopolysaccharide biosynthesis protein [Thermosipho melanesiensis]OOC35614.1 lipopolysaccharide biosynthesis protein [Thermosipho melanesiensis]OOC39288.1 lipopolysaccharide biosynthesis protein [Thermosipho melanesiensis]OOC39374.1 lipopolysaccharide biosynthesis protein [Thermosipho melanesiensis]